MFDAPFTTSALRDFAPAIAVALLGTGITLLVLRGATALITRTKSSRPAPRLLAAALEKVSAIFVLVICLGTSTALLGPHGATSLVLSKAAIFAALYLLGRVLSVAISFWGSEYASSTNGSRATALRLLVFFGQIAAWCVVTLLILQNLGLNVTTLIAGLGVGSIAIALAVQNILGDVFCSLSILIDRPFEEGDYIAVDSFAGTVERIGLKSTRVRSPQGQQIVFSNANLLASRIQNFEKRLERRIQFTLGVRYDTDSQKRKDLPKLVREVIEKQPEVRFEGAFLKNLGDSALQYEVTYRIISRNLGLDGTTQEAINLGILAALENAGIKLALTSYSVEISNRAA
jgi:small-conductance mechanosensitive channel